MEISRAENQNLSIEADEIKKSAITRHLTDEQRKKLALSFFKKMKNSIEIADSYVAKFNIGNIEENMLPEGGGVLMQPVFPPSLKVNGLISGKVRNGKIVLSLTDFVSVLELPIYVDPEKKQASGWYIRQNKNFFLDFDEGYVSTDHGKFSFSKNVYFEDGDIFADVREMGEWFDFKIKTDVSTQEVEIVSKTLLPLQERYNRRKLTYASAGERPKASLPREKNSEYKIANIPFVDVTANSSYTKKGDSEEPLVRHDANIKTSGDFAKGTLSSLTQLNNRDSIRSIRLTYKRESDKPELLGGLRARKFELGDVTSTVLPLGGSARQELGAHITNIDPVRGTRNPTTIISGEALPGWDVELYRGNQLMGFQEVDEEGLYKFENILLFQSDNKFRLVFYGPQGEEIEENVSVPVESSRLAENDSVYDVSLTLDRQQTYLAKEMKNDDIKPTPNFVASYERPIGKSATAGIGIRTNETSESRNYVANAGISKVALQTLFNADVGVDDEGDVMAELSARRSFAEHDFSNRVTWTGADYDMQSGSSSNVGILQNNFDLSGPLSFFPGRNPTYNISAYYNNDTDGLNAYGGSAGVGTAWKALTLSNDINYESGSEKEETINTNTNVTGTYGRNRVRLSANYELKPESELKRVLANYRRYITKKVDFEAEASHNPEQLLTEYSAKLDWQAGFVRVSPRVSYNTEKDFYAGLTTRFGVLKEPHTNNLKFYDRNITSSGGISAFVYLDKNGDYLFNEGDEPIPNVVVQCLQNGGRERTDDKGIAVFNRLRETKATDVFIDTETFEDPVWVSGFKGSSILPRAGYIASIDFPVHISGEIDGIVYIEDQSDRQSLKNITVNLYNAEGNVEQSVVTDIGGFYYFSQIPPGRYLLIVDEMSARRGNFVRPEPQQIEIGYNGTVAYGNDIVVVSGKNDVPSEIKADLTDYKALHSQIDFSHDNFDLVLNLGDYNSNVLMSLIWYKLKMRYAAIVAGAHIFVPPSQSYADAKTGKHTLRVGLRDETIEGAYRRCRALIAREQYCKVEIFPIYMKQAKAEADVLEEKIIPQ